ncbi:hypothetical protein KUCAC02_026823 [Chaenocephalus aceratus]|nr:hypothetical protein KUCAC02_026823 [Chaenocephalus aceratus]
MLRCDYSEPHMDIKCGLTIAHCPISPPRFLPGQNSRKLGRRANKQRRLQLSTLRPSGPEGRTRLRLAVSVPYRKLISVASQFNGSTVCTVEGGVY